jgi:uncharacterized protein (DUF58 family)
MSISSREPEALSRDPQALLQRLEWTVIRRLDGLLHGDYRTLFRGFGLDLADLREYQFNDDVRRIDWNVTARMQTPYVREYHEDREVSAWFLVDLSGSIGFGSGAQTKHMLTVDFVAVMARLLSGHGNAVGAMCYGQRVDQVLAARTGRRHVLYLMQQLQARGQPLSASRQGARSPQPRGTGTATDLGELLRAAAKLIKRRSLVFVVSDFISEPGWASALSQLSQRHEVVAIRIHDPLESRLPDLGLVTIEDAETGEQLFVDTGDLAFRRRFEAIAATRETALRDALARAGVDALELSTDEDLADAVLRFADLRRQRSRRNAGRTMPGHLTAVGNAAR